MDLLPLVSACHWHLCLLVPAQTFPSIFWPMVSAGLLSHPYVNLEYSSSIIVLLALLAIPMLRETWVAFSAMLEHMEALEVVGFSAWTSPTRAIVICVSSLHSRRYGELACYSFLHLEREHMFQSSSLIHYRSPFPCWLFFSLPSPGHHYLLRKPIIHSMSFI